MKFYYSACLHPKKGDDHKIVVDTLENLVRPANSIVRNGAASEWEAVQIMKARKDDPSNIETILFIKIA